MHGADGNDNDSTRRHSSDSSESESSEDKSEDFPITRATWSSYWTKRQIWFISVFEIEEYISWCRDWGYPWISLDETIGEELYLVTEKEYAYYTDHKRFEDNGVQVHWY